MLNAANGIHVAGYRAKARGYDREFQLLARYLLMIKDLSSVRGIYREWRHRRGDLPRSAEPTFCYHCGFRGLRESLCIVCGLCCSVLFIL